MAERRVHVNLKVDDNFTGTMALVKEAATHAFDRASLAAATWEPHDWSDFE